MGDIFLIIAIMIVNIFIFRLLFRMILGSMYSFLEALRYLFIPNCISALRGNYWEDLINTAKLYFFILCCIVIVVIEINIMRIIMD